MTKTFNISSISIRSIRIFLFALLFILSACKAQKMLESSHRNKPNWVHSIQHGFIIGIGTGPSIEAARDNALDNIRDQITRSVVSEIQSKRAYNAREVFNGKNYKVVSTFVKETIANTPQAIATRGISISNASDFYYEVVKDRQTKRTNIMYAVRYPFSRLELQTYLNAWDRQQQRLVQQMEEIEKRLGKHESVERVMADIQRLNGLKELMETEHAMNSQALIKELHSYLSTFQIKVLEEGVDYIRFGLINQNHEIAIATRPQVQSDLVNIQSIVQHGKHWVVKYNENAQNDSRVRSNRLTITFRTKNFEAEYTHNLKANVRVNLLSPLLFNGVQYSFWGTEVRAYDFSIQSSVSGLGGITLERIIINPLKITRNRNQSLTPININFIRKIHAHTGNTVNRVRVESTLNRFDLSLKNGAKIIARGTLYYTENLTGQRKSINFNNVDLVTDW